MKTGHKKSVISAALVLCLLAGMSASAKVQQASMPYQFPPSAKNMTSTYKRIAAYQIPEEILKRMSTKALVNTVLSDSYLTEFGAYSTSLDAMRMNRESFNIYPEMESRADYYEVLAGLYEKVQVITEEDRNSRDIPYEELYYLENLETLIAVDIYEHGQDAQARAGREQWDEVIRAANKRICAAREAEENIYSPSSNGFYWLYIMLPDDAVLDEDTEPLLAELADAENYYN